MVVAGEAHLPAATTKIMVQADVGKPKEAVWEKLLAVMAEISAMEGMVAIRSG